MTQRILPIYFCAWPGCERTKLHGRGLCGTCWMRAKTAGTLDDFIDPRKINRFCEVCDEPVPMECPPKATTCSRYCIRKKWSIENAELKKQRAREWYEENRELTIQRATERYEANPELIKANIKRIKRANVEKYRAHGRANSATRRARKANAYVDTPDEAFVWQRDEGLCWLCEEPVDPDLSPPNPKSASIDHVIPLSKGGAHSIHNVALAHLGCNCSKHAKLIDKRPRWWPSVPESA